MTGVDEAFATVDDNILPLAVTVNALTLDTVPPLPLADKTPAVLNAKPEPIVISPGADAAELDLFPNNV